MKCWSFSTQVTWRSIRPRPLLLRMVMTIRPGPGSFSSPNQVAPSPRRCSRNRVYPDLRYFEGGPPIPPYDVTAQTLGMLMGVDVRQVERKFEADLELLEEITPPPAAFPKKPSWAYLIGPESNAGFLALARLQKENVPVFRAAKGFQADGKQHSPGTWIVPPKGKAGAVLQTVSKETGLTVSGTNRAPGIDGYRIKAPTRIGLYKVAGNMPAGWMMWLFEQYGFNHQVMSSTDFAGDLSSEYDVIVLPAGTSKSRMIRGAFTGPA